MKRWIAAITLLGFLCACAPTESTPEPTAQAAETAPAAAATLDVGQTAAPERKEDFLAAIDGQAFAAVMAGYLGGNETIEDPDRTMLCWDMAGWYAAREYRINGYDLIEVPRIEDFLRSVGFEGTTPPESWLEYGVMEERTAPDGGRYYVFGQHCREIDAMLGVTTEVRITVTEDGTVEGVVTEHYENGQSMSRRYVLSFVPNDDADSRFAYRLTDITPPDDVNMVGELTFTWEELLAANRLDNILSIYPALRHCNQEYAPELVTWVYPRGSGLTILTLSEDYASGYYNGCYFTAQPREDGRLLASIEEFRDSYTDPAERDEYLIDFLSGIVEMRYEKTEGDLIWMECTAWGGMRERVAVDRGTLALREVQTYFAEDLPPSRLVVLYDETAPALEYLDSWDGPQRRVAIHWEEFSTGERNAWDEIRQIPADWEYVPWEGRWGDFAVWMDEGYTKSYAYPGDGVDYELWLTTAKG